MKPYIRMNTELGKEATNELETSSYKLMDNSVFGKTMENVRKRVDIKIVLSGKKKPKLITIPLIAGCTHFFNSFAGFSMHRENVRLDKPVYAGMTILDNSKILMYDFFSTTRSKSSTRRGVKSSKQTQTASSWRYKTTMSTRTWKTESICTTQEITPMITCFTATHKKCFGQDERQDSGSANRRVCLPSAKNVLNPGREAKHQKVEWQEKVSFAERNKALALQRGAFLQNKTFRHEMNMLCSEGHEIYEVRVNRII